MSGVQRSMVYMYLTIGFVATTTACIGDQTWLDTTSDEAAATHQDEIISGVTTTIEQNPWQVAIVTPFGNNLQCGGSIPMATALLSAPATTSWILTAAHCIIYPINSLKILAGTSTINIIGSGEERMIDDVEIIPGSKHDGVDDSLAMLHLSTPLNLSTPSMHAIPMMTSADVAAGATNAGVDSIVTGWGLLSDQGTTANNLVSVHLPFVSNATAAAAYASHSISITSDEIAAGGGPATGSGLGSGTCHGDSGGPLTASANGIRKLIGVVQWGANAAFKPCATPGLPDVFSRITSFIPQINSYLRNIIVLLGLPDESGAAGQFVNHAFTVPTGVSSITVRLYGGISGDADLYVRQGALPTTINYSCRPFLDGNNETCTIDAPTAGTWYVSLFGFTNYNDVSLSVTALELPRVCLPGRVC